MSDETDRVTEPAITVIDVLRRAQGYLAGRGVDSPRLDAELLLADVLACDRLALYTGFDRPLTLAETDGYRRAIARRGHREPVAYIVGSRGFRNITLRVSPDVLVPRPETELLVEWVVEGAAHGATILDWGTGSGAIALAIADERPDLVVVGIDRSPTALAVARSNDHARRVEWLVSDGFGELAGRSFDIVVANPPYLAEGELDGLQPELGHEPVDALVSGPRGLESYESIVTGASDHLRPGGLLIFEVGATQAAAVQDLLTSAGFRTLEVRHDLAGHARAVGGMR